MTITTVEEDLKEHGFTLLRTKGVSMEPIIHENTTVVCVKRAANDIKKWDVVLFFRNSKTNFNKRNFILHRVIKVKKNGDLIICGDNTVIPENIDRENIIGIMTGYYNEGKFIDCNKDKDYLRYVKLWYPKYIYRLLRWCAGTVRRKLKHE